MAAPEAPAALLGFPRGSTGKGGEGAAGSCIWIRMIHPPGMIPCGDRLQWGCAALSCPHKEVLYAAWQNPRGCGFLRKEGVLFGLQGCLSSATSQCLWLPASMAIVGLWQLEESWQGLACWVLCGCSVVLVGRAPTNQCSQNHGSPVLGAV